MSRPTPPSEPVALRAVERLESALADDDDVRDAARATLDAARAEAQRLIADARTRGTDEGRRRRAALLAEAEAEATEIRAAGEAEARELLRRVAVERDDLVAELTAELLVPEA
jgi:vacuolar-type H+-ATPase subunit H